MWSAEGWCICESGVVLSGGNSLCSIIRFCTTHWRNGTFLVLSLLCQQLYIYISFFVIFASLVASQYYKSSSMQHGYFTRGHVPVSNALHIYRHSPDTCTTLTSKCPIFSLNFFSFAQSENILKHARTLLGYSIECYDRGSSFLEIDDCWLYKNTLFFF